ncbi:carbohydrate-binding domain-containing protein, partial [Falsiroseomonas sp.]|uniref:carbohydrate-binding domain-containing protein n=1 Tax=Falsiroseomonas sp. TaxID=2870721 RepID=UPI0027226EA6
PAGVPLTIRLGAESWQGDPIAVVTLNGETVFNGAITAPLATGGQVVELGRVDAGQPHQVSVQFTNDAWGGTATTDRNLHVQAIEIGGVDTGSSRTLMSNGTASFTVAAAQPAAEPPAPPEPAAAPASAPAPADTTPPVSTGDDTRFSQAEWDAVMQSGNGQLDGEGVALVAWPDSDASVLADADMMNALQGTQRADPTAGDFLFV